MIFNLNSLIPKKFLKVVKEVLTGKLDFLICKGGRSSLKSTVIAYIIVVGCMVLNRSAVCLLAVGNRLEDRLVNTFKEVIHFLGVEQYWKLRKSPLLEYVLLNKLGKETNVSIKFTFAQRSEDVKGFKPRPGTGGFAFVFLEELTNFKSEHEFNGILSTFLRGEGKCTVLCAYNPPMRASNWVNAKYSTYVGELDDVDELGTVYSTFEFTITDKYGNPKTLLRKQAVHHSTYLDIICEHPEWIGYEQIGIIEQMRQTNEREYRHLFLGEVLGTDANVFSNVVDWDGVLPTAVAARCTELSRGMDYGLGGADPTVYIQLYYDRVGNAIYIDNEWVKQKASLDDIVQNVKRLNPHNFPIYADSATPIMTSELNGKGLSVLPAIKGPDSVKAGIRWLQSLNAIYICPTKTKTAYKEFKEYEYVVINEDEITSELPDRNNHCIDATRYGLCLNIKHNV